MFATIAAATVIWRRHALRLHHHADARCDGRWWLAMLLAAATAQAEEAVPVLSEQDYLEDLPVVLSATRLNQSLSDTPVAMTVIDRPMIEAVGARSLADVLRLVPGMVVGYESGYRQAVSYHGLADVNARRMQVLIDGRSVYLPSVGGVPWADLPLALDDIERIEVIRGPNAATYGANAFLGTISITTRHAAAGQGGAAKAQLGTHGIRDAEARYSAGMGPWNYRVAVGHEEDNGFDAQRDSQRANYISARADYRIDLRSTIELQAGYKQGARQRGEEGDPQDPPHRREIASQFEQLRWRHSFNSGNELILQIYHDRHDSEERYRATLNLAPLPITLALPLNLDVESQRYDAELQHSLALRSDWRFVWGVGARRDEVEAPSFFRNEGRIRNRIYRGFASTEWRATERLLFNAGVMLERNEISGSDVSPRLAANFRITPEHSVRYGISRATRNPLLVEERANAVFCVNPSCTIFVPFLVASGDLKSERILSRELGYIGQYGRRLTLDAKYYRDQVHGLIAERGTDFVNGDRVSISGYELQTQWRATPTTRLIASYARTIIGSDDQYDNYSTSAPKDSGSLLWIQDFPPLWQSGVAFYYAAPMQFLDAKPIGAVRRLDVRIARRVRWVDMDGTVALTLQNILDSYDEYTPRARVDNQFDTRMYLSFGLRFF